MRLDFSRVGALPSGLAEIYMTNFCRVFGPPAASGGAGGHAEPRSASDSRSPAGQVSKAESGTLSSGGRMLAAVMVCGMAVRAS